VPALRQCGARKGAPKSFCFADCNARPQGRSASVCRKGKHMNTMIEGIFQKGTSLMSLNGTFKLVFQGDGNLVLLCRNDANTGYTPFWQSGTGSGEVANPGFQLQLLNGGLAIYSFVESPGTNDPIWAKSGPGAAPKSVLIVQNDGNLVIYNPSMKAVWQSGTSAMEEPGCNVPDAARGLELGPP